MRVNAGQNKRYEDEIKRHTKALEDLQKAKETFYQNEVKQHDKLQQLRQQLVDSKNDIVTTDKALDQLRQVQSIQYNGKTFNRAVVPNLLLPRDPSLILKISADP